MIDVFAGAGGLSLGFKWAGWESLAAVDLDRYAVATFNLNVAPVAFVGDMENPEIQDRLVDAARDTNGRRLALVEGRRARGSRRAANGAQMMTYVMGCMKATQSS